VQDRRRVDQRSPGAFQVRSRERAGNNATGGHRATLRPRTSLRLGRRVGHMGGWSERGLAGRERTSRGVLGNPTQCRHA
jgi:hypothetical protein